MPATVRFIVLAICVALLAQIALYWPTFHQIPFGDDWGPPLTEISRGELVGPLSFFTETRQPDSYRPLQSLLIWAFGRIDEPGRWVSIRVLHFLSSGIALAVLGLLLRQWRVGRAGVVVAATVAVLHPSLVAPVGSIDGFSSLLSCAAVWWGVWMMERAHGRVWLGIGLAALAMIIGTLVKEYAFAMGPMAVIAAWFFYRPRWRSAFMTAAVMGVLTFALLWVRRFVKPTDMELPPHDFDFDSARVLLENLVLVPVGGFFFGDSLRLYVERSGTAIASSLVVVALTAFALGVGLWRRVNATSGEPGEDRRSQDGASVRVAFLVFSMPAITFPAIAVMRISEMYLCGLVTMVALLCALAADGWTSVASRTMRRIALGVACVIAVSSIIAARHKIDAMIALGTRTRLQTDAIIAAAKGLPDGSTIALLYREDQVERRSTFSSFRLPDKFCVRSPAAAVLFPGRRITLLCPENPRFDPDAPVRVLPNLAAVKAFDRGKADVVLYWDVDASRFERLK